MFTAIEQALDAEDFEEALRLLDAMPAEPGLCSWRARAYLGRGVAAHLAGRYADAMVDFELAVALDSMIPNIETYLAMARRGAPPPSWD